MMGKRVIVMEANAGYTPQDNQADFGLISPFRQS